MKYVFLPEDSLIALGILIAESTLRFPEGQTVPVVFNKQLLVGQEFDVTFKSLAYRSAPTGTLLEVVHTDVSVSGRVTVYFRSVHGEISVVPGDHLAEAVLTEKIGIKTLPKVTTEVSYTPTYSLDVPKKKGKKKS